MSFPTTPTYIQHILGWPEHTREHPVIDWMFDYEKALDWGDMKSGPYTAWHSDDFVYAKSGVAHPPGAVSWAKFLSDYAPFTAHYHEPIYYVLHETETGWELIGEANVYVKLPVPGGEKVKDGEGREWDMKAPGAFHFIFLKDPSGPKGIKMQKQIIYADMLPVAKELVKRGMITWEQAAEL